MFSNNFMKTQMFPSQTFLPIKCPFSSIHYRRVIHQSPSKVLVMTFQQKNYFLLMAERETNGDDIISNEENLGQITTKEKLFC